ncbi:MAG: PAS and helix-turn-helix domain-containing protein [Nitrospira sp.]|nr:PAS and helix-turn-helix domain-containing protein [Nitrospira sp.]
MDRTVMMMLSRTADGAMLVNEDGKVIFWNKAAERLLGFRAQDVIGRPCREVLCGDTLGGQPLCSPSCAIGSKLAGGVGVRNHDMQTHTKSGRVVWINISSLPVPSRKKHRFLAMHLFRDITKQLKMARLADDLHALLSIPGGKPVSETTRRRSTPKETGELPTISSTLPLSLREKEVLRLLAAGKTAKDIADMLYISAVTVRNHIQHILEKLGAHSRLQALALAFPPGGFSPQK